MHNMKFSTVVRRTLVRGAPLLVAGLVGLGAAGVASADGYRHDHERRVERIIVIDEYGARGGAYRGAGRDYDRRAYLHRWRRHWRRPRTRVVHVYHHYNPRPVREVVRYESRPYVAAAPVRRRYAGSVFNAQSLIGAALGGLIGSRVGGGSGNRAATAAGAVTGLWLGSQYGR